MITFLRVITITACSRHVNNNSSSSNQCKEPIMVTRMVTIRTSHRNKYLMSSAIHFE